MESLGEGTSADKCTYNNGGYQQCVRSKVKKKREFVLHHSVEAAIQNLGKAAIKSIMKKMYQFKAVNLKQLSVSGDAYVPERYVKGGWELREAEVAPGSTTVQPSGA